MYKHSLRIFLSVSLSLAFLLGLTGLTYAVEGLEPLNNLRAKLGNITPGDAPGFPITISRPGSYILTGNLADYPTEGPTLIEITSSFVTLDLNGFSTSTGGSASGPVIKASEGTRNVTILNGNIMGGGMGGGIILQDYSVVEKINILAGEGGLKVGDFSKVRDSTTNGRPGIWAGDYCIVSNNITLSPGNGISVGKNSKVYGNDVSGAFFGIKAESNCIISGNILNYVVNGIIAEAGCVISGNTLTQGTTGIQAGDGCKVTGNTVSNYGGFGLTLGANTGYSNNVLTGNNGGNSNPQVSGGIEMGSNICGTDTICP